MTWKQCRDAALFKMFGGENAPTAADEESRAFCAALPAAAAEAMLLLCQDLPLTARTRAEAIPGRALELDEVCPGWFTPQGMEVWQQSGQGLPQRVEHRVLAGRWLMLAPGAAGSVELLYRVLPACPTAATPDDWELPLPEDAAVLVPLYAAAELYKQEDAALATLWRNEFEVGRAALAARLPAGDEAFYSATGWC